MKTSIPIMLGAAAIVTASCATHRTGEKREVETKPFKHELIENKFGCWEFDRNPEYVAFQYGNAMLGVGGTYIECMKSAIARHQQQAKSLAEKLAATPEGAAEAEDLRRRLAQERELAEEATTVYTDWRRRNWK